MNWPVILSETHNTYVGGRLTAPTADYKYDGDDSYYVPEDEDDIPDEVWDDVTAINQGADPDEKITIVSVVEIEQVNSGGSASIDVAELNHFYSKVDDDPSPQNGMVYFYQTASKTIRGKRRTRGKVTRGSGGGGIPTQESLKTLTKK